MNRIYLLLVFSVILFCCKKEKNETICLNGAVKWGGDPAADGLGWYIMDSVGGLKNYIPENLPDNLKADGLSVRVCLYETSTKFYCQCAYPLNKYHITFIKKN